jgi:4-hydroxythreonine-4-phosphate dehydrogenase
LLEFIFMLTKDDTTVQDCLTVYDEVRANPLRWVGFKDVGVPVTVLKELAQRIHDDGRQVALEVVSLDATNEERSVESGLEIGVDMLMGGTNPDRALPLLRGSGIRYAPFVGNITGHPSILSGTPEEIAESARELTGRDGVHGLDLLAYRWDGPATSLVTAVVAASRGPVVVAGSIASREQIGSVAASGAWGFTIGSAVFDRLLVPSGSISDQVGVALAMTADAEPLQPAYEEAYPAARADEPRVTPA